MVRAMRKVSNQVKVRMLVLVCALTAVSRRVRDNAFWYKRLLVLGVSKLRFDFQCVNKLMN